MISFFARKEYLKWVDVRRRVFAECTCKGIMHIHALPPTKNEILYKCHDCGLVLGKKNTKKNISTLLELTKEVIQIAQEEYGNIGFDEETGKYKWMVITPATVPWEEFENSVDFHALQIFEGEYLK